MKQRPSLLIVDVGQEPLGQLAMRLAQLGFHALRAKTAEQAFETLQDPRYAVGAVLLPEDLPVFDLDRALEAFRGSDDDRTPTLVACGVRPDIDRRNRLRTAGADLALWNPVDDHTLRFQLNRALAAGGPPLHSRQNERVPTNWPIRVRAGSREKHAKLYSVSAQGAFIATSSPSMTRSRISFSLPLPSEDCTVAAEVVMTNVPGNLVKSNLPIGMGVRFTELDSETRAALLAYTGERAAHLVL